MTFSSLPCPSECRAVHVFFPFLTASPDSANLSRYGITIPALEKAMKTSEKVKCALICLDRGDEGKELARRLPGKAYQVSEMKALPQVLSSVLTSMLEA